MELSEDIPVTLVIKAPNQRLADQTVDCMLGWTIKKLKQHLETVYPSKPVCSISIFILLDILHRDIDGHASPFCESFGTYNQISHTSFLTSLGQFFQIFFSGQFFQISFSFSLNFLQ